MTECYICYSKPPKFVRRSLRRFGALVFPRSSLGKTSTSLRMTCWWNVCDTLLFFVCLSFNITSGEEHSVHFPHDILPTQKKPPPRGEVARVSVTERGYVAPSQSPMAPALPKESLSPYSKWHSLPHGGYFFIEMAFFAASAIFAGVSPYASRSAGTVPECP